MCEQEYHGVVQCALGWACWKTYVGRPETDQLRRMAMNLLGLGLFDSEQFLDALSVQEAILSTVRRLGAPEAHILALQNNLANTYHKLERREEASRILRDVYSGYLKLFGGDHLNTLAAAYNYADSLAVLNRLKENKALLRKNIPVAQRVLGESNDLTLRMKCNYAIELLRDNGATLDDLREGVTTLEDTARITRRVFGGAHPDTIRTESSLRKARIVLRARETPSPGSS